MERENAKCSGNLSQTAGVDGGFKISYHVRWNPCQVILVRTTFLLSAGDGERAAVILLALLGLRGCGRRSSRAAGRDEHIDEAQHQVGRTL